MVSIEMKNEYGVYKIECEEDYVNIYELADHLIKPMLLAAGFHPNNVTELFGGTDE